MNLAVGFRDELADFHLTACENGEGGGLDAAGGGDGEATGAKLLHHI